MQFPDDISQELQPFNIVQLLQVLPIMYCFAGQERHLLAVPLQEMHGAGHVEHPRPLGHEVGGHDEQFPDAISQEMQPLAKVQFTHLMPDGMLICFPDTHDLHVMSTPLGSFPKEHFVQIPVGAH